MHGKAISAVVWGRMSPEAMNTCLLLNHSILYGAARHNHVHPVCSGKLVCRQWA